MNILIFAAAVALSNTVTVLPPVIVEASRLDQTKNEISSHVEVISKDEIESSGAENTVELLEKRANIFIRKQNSNPAQSQISMRGYGANGFGRVKILVDGVALNNADMSPQNLMRVPVRSIRKIEILHGPQTFFTAATPPPASSTSSPTPIPVNARPNSRYMAATSARSASMREREVV